MSALKIVFYKDQSSKFQIFELHKNKMNGKLHQGCLTQTVQTLLKGEEISRHFRYVIYGRSLITNRSSHLA